MAGSAAMGTFEFMAYFANQDEEAFKTTAMYAGVGAGVGALGALAGRSMLAFMIFVPIGAAAGLATRYYLDPNKPRIVDEPYFQATVVGDPFRDAMRGGPWQAADESSFGARVAPLGGALHYRV